MDFFKFVNLYSTTGEAKRGQFVEDMPNINTGMVKTGSFIDETGHWERVTVIEKYPGFQQSPYVPTDYNKLF